MHFLNEIAQHGLRDIEISDHPVFHRTNRGDITRGAPEHLFGLIAHGEHFARNRMNRDDAGFAEHNTFIFYVDEGIGGAQVDTDVVREKTQQLVKHWSDDGEEVY